MANGHEREIPLETEYRSGVEWGMRWSLDGRSILIGAGEQSSRRVDVIVSMRPAARSHLSSRLTRRKRRSPRTHNTLRSEVPRSLQRTGCPARGRFFEPSERLIYCENSPGNLLDALERATRQDLGEATTVFATVGVGRRRNDRPSQASPLETAAHAMWRLGSGSTGWPHGCQHLNRRGAYGLL